MTGIRRATLSTRCWRTWFGKRFHPDMRADALLFEAEPGRLIPVDPKFFPIRLANRFAVFGRSARGWNLFQHIRPRARAWGTTASSQMRKDDNVMTAAMVYDPQPITDYFRGIDKPGAGRPLSPTDDDARHAALAASRRRPDQEQLGLRTSVKLLDSSSVLSAVPQVNCTKKRVHIPSASSFSVATSSGLTRHEALPTQSRTTLS